MEGAKVNADLVEKKLNEIIGLIKCLIASVEASSESEDSGVDTEEDNLAGKGSGRGKRFAPNSGRSYAAPK